MLARAAGRRHHRVDRRRRSRWSCRAGGTRPGTRCSRTVSAPTSTTPGRVGCRGSERALLDAQPGPGGHRHPGNERWRRAMRPDYVRVGRAPGWIWLRPPLPRPRACSTVCEDAPGSPVLIAPSPGAVWPDEPDVDRPPRSRAVRRSAGWSPTRCSRSPPGPSAPGRRPGVGALDLVGLRRRRVLLPPPALGDPHRLRARRAAPSGRRSPGSGSPSLALSVVTGALAWLAREPLFHSPTGGSR